jgi:hypothetical protein
MLSKSFPKLSKNCQKVCQKVVKKFVKKEIVYKKYKVQIENFPKSRTEGDTNPCQKLKISFGRLEWRTSSGSRFWPKWNSLACKKLLFQWTKNGTV